MRVNSLWDNVLRELCGISKKARVRGLEIGNPLEHSGSGYSKLNVAYKECQEEELAEHAGHHFKNQGSYTDVPNKRCLVPGLLSDNYINRTPRHSRALMRTKNLNLDISGMPSATPIRTGEGLRVGDFTGASTGKSVKQAVEVRVYQENGRLKAE